MAAPPLFAHDPCTLQRKARECALTHSTACFKAHFLRDLIGSMGTKPIGAAYTPKKLSLKENINSKYQLHFCSLSGHRSTLHVFIHHKWATYFDKCSRLLQGCPVAPGREVVACTSTSTTAWWCISEKFSITSLSRCTK